MEKSYIFIMIIVIVIGFTQYSEYIIQNDVFEVGQTVFAIPEGYHLGNDNQFGAKTLTNGVNSIYLYENVDNNVSNHVNDYMNAHNQSVNVDNFKIDGYSIYKTSTPIDSNTHHYFVLKNNKVYDIYNFDGNNRMDAQVITLVTSDK